jgi:hypothetical protein
MRRIFEIYDHAGAKANEIIEDARYQGMKLKKEAEGAGDKIAGEVQERSVRSRMFWGRRKGE